MSSTSIFTTVVSAQHVEFCTGFAAVTFMGPAPMPRLLQVADHMAGCVISSFKPAAECIALSFRPGNNARTTRQAVRYSCCTMLMYKQSNAVPDGLIPTKYDPAVITDAISELIDFIRVKIFDERRG
jgi:hypothetical protein